MSSQPSATIQSIADQNAMIENYKKLLEILNQLNTVHKLSELKIDQNAKQLLLELLEYNRKKISIDEVISIQEKLLKLPVKTISPWINEITNEKDSLSEKKKSDNKNAIIFGALTVLLLIAFTAVLLATNPTHLLWLIPCIPMFMAEISAGLFAARAEYYGKKANEIENNVSSVLTFFPDYSDDKETEVDEVQENLLTLER